MFTVRDMIVLTLKKIRVAPVAGSPSPDDTGYAFQEFKLMMDTWSMDGTTVFTKRTVVFPLAGGKSVYTIGESALADVNEVRPIRFTAIDFSYLSDSVRYPVSQITALDFADISNQNISGRPVYMYYEPKMPLGEMTFYPPPVEGSIRIVYDLVYPEMDYSFDLEANYPPGYVSAIAYSLGMRLAPTYGQQLSQEYREEAIKAFRAIVVQARPIEELRMPLVTSSWQDYWSRNRSYGID
jgi:hypothetical protein